MILLLYILMAEASPFDILVCIFQMLSLSQFFTPHGTLRAECFADWSIDWVIDNGANEIQLSGSFPVLRFPFPVLLHVPVHVPLLVPFTFTFFFSINYTPKMTKTNQGKYGKSLFKVLDHPATLHVVGSTLRVLRGVYYITIGISSFIWFLFDLLWGKPKQTATILYERQ